MGTTVAPRARGVSNIEFFTREFGDGRQGGEGVIAAASHGFTEVYLAYRGKRGAVHAIVCKVHWRSKVGAWEPNYAYKDMSEGVRPYYDNCPAKIMRLLSPPEDTFSGGMLDWAREWRQAQA